jgi:arsenite methyltransferase
MTKGSTTSTVEDATDRGPFGYDDDPPTDAKGTPRMSSPSLTLDTPELASHYEEASSHRQFQVGKVLVKKLGLQLGDRVLDVGSGTGLLAEHVAGVVGPSGSVVAIDPLPLRIDIAQRRAQPNLTFRGGDAYELGAYEDASFDVVYLNAVFHWLPEKLGPLRQFCRVLRAGGRLGITTGSREHISQVQTIRNRVLAREPYARFLESQTGMPHRVSAGEFRGLLEQTGFEVQSIEVIPNVVVHGSAEAAIEFTQASSFGNFLGHLPDDLRPSAREAIRQELEALRTPEGIRAEGMRIIAVARKAGNEGASIR